MAPPTTTQNAQRLDKLEEDLSALRSSLESQIAKAMAKATLDLQASITAGFDQTVTRLEERSGSHRETQERMIASMRDEQKKFQQHISTTVNHLREGVPINHSNREAQIHSPGGSHQERTPEERETSLRSEMNREERRGGSENGRFVGNWKYRKLDMPVFDGQDLDGWIVKAERYFQFFGLNAEEKLEAAVVGLDREALSWYQWERGRRVISGWPALRETMLQRFRPAHAGSLYEQWMTVAQTTTVLEYRKEFVRLAAPLEKVPESILLAQFLNGLNEEIRVEVRMSGPNNLDQAMDLAIKVEERLRVSKQVGLRGSGSGAEWGMQNPYYKNTGPTHANSQRSPADSYSQNSPPFSCNQSSPPNNTSQKHSNLPTTSNSTNHTTQKTPIHFNLASKIGGEVRRLSDREYQEKKKRGLCFRCDDKWTVGHRCRRKELSVLLAVDGEEEGEAEEVEVEPEVNPEVDPSARFSLTRLSG